MLLRFTKMHGLGNDFVVIDAVSQNIRVDDRLARRLADRHCGVGCDQVLVVAPPAHHDNDFSYRIFNADGSEVEQCGNGARCFAKFVRDQKLTGKNHIRVETAKGLIKLRVSHHGQISVDMGAPILEPSQIPFDASALQNCYDLQTSAGTLQVAAVSMGNPHVVLSVDNVKDAPVEELGRELEQHPRFPQRVNVGFMAVKNRTEIDLRVFERGTGETLACGSGACAAVVAGRLQDLLDSPTKVNLPGGSLTVEWAGSGQAVVMTGPASTVFQGRIRL